MPKSRRIKRKKRKQRERKNKKRIGLLWLVGMVLVVVFIAYFVYKLSIIQKFSYVQMLNFGDTEVVVYDPKKEKITRILIPGDTQLELSYNLGDYRLKNAWKLAETEDLEGVLITRTLVKNFSIPVYLYKIEGLSNLDIFKRVKIWMIEKRLGGVSVVQYDLRETRVLKEKRLLDGETGFTIKEEIPSYITVNFAEPEFGEFVPKVDIVDKTGDYRISDSVSKVLSVMGAKVSSYSKSTPEEFNCMVSGKNQMQVKTTALIFNCEVGEDLVGESDLQIILGKDFVKNF